MSLFRDKAVFAATIALAMLAWSPTNGWANSVDIYDSDDVVANGGFLTIADGGTADLSALGNLSDGTVPVTINGFLAENSNPLENPRVPAGVASLSSTYSYTIDGSPDSSEAQEATRLAIILGIASPSGIIGTQSTAFTTETDGTNEFTISAVTAYFSVKIGNQIAFFQNVAGAALSLVYDGESSAGLSHFTTYACAVGAACDDGWEGPLEPVPLPGAILFLLSGLVGLGFIGRMRRPA